MIKRLLLSFSFVVFSLSCAAAEEPASVYVEGTDYDLISPAVRTQSPNEIEVAEFFWYGCSHCYTFEPLIQQWKKTMPAGVSFRGIPAVWRENMELHARAYFTAEVLGVLETMNPVLFQAMNVDKKPLGTEGEIRKLFVANGVSAEDFDKTFGSFGVGSQVNQGIATAKAAKITGTPALMVNGKYLVTGRKAGTQVDMLKVVDFLVAKEGAAAAK